MARRVQPRDLISDCFLREIRHFLWVESSLLGDRVDAGWSCRDHALVTAFLIRLLGYELVFRNGEALFAKRRNGKSDGFSFTQNPHSWLFVRGIGAIDLSIKPYTGVQGDDVRIGIKCVYGGEWIPRGRGKAYFFEDSSEFARAVDSLPQHRHQASVAYLAREAEYFHRGHLTHAAGWTASPLTKLLDSTYGANPSDLYAALMLHLRSFLEGTAASMSIFSFSEAWSRLAEVRKGAIDRALQCMQEANTVLSNAE